MSVAPDVLTPEDYRRRYFELKREADENNKGLESAPLRANPRTVPPSDILTEETVPGGWYWSGRIARGTTLRIVNEHATEGVSLLLWNAKDMSERYNAGDTVKVQWTSHLTKGRLLFSDMGRVLASITEDTCGAHDFIAGGSTRASNLRKHGGASVENPDGRNSHDNFLLAAVKHGLGPRDVGPCVTFFAPVIVAEDGHFAWKDGVLYKGAYVDLRAEMDLIAALSNCPHPLSPSSEWHAAPVRVLVWRSTPAEASDYCRAATGEAVRAFINTDLYAGPKKGGAQ